MGIFDSLNDITVNFSDTLKVPILNEEGKELGKLSDYFVDYEEVYPQVLAIQYKKNKQIFYISWENILDYSLKRIIIKSDSPIGRSRTFPKASKERVVKSILAEQYSSETVEYPSLGKLILDKQIVDTSGKKVVRVNDIQFVRASNLLRVTHAAVGIRSMMRRLGYERVIDSFLKIVRPGANYLKKETLINWKFVHAIPDKSVQSSLKIKLSNQDIKNMHPADIADILEDLDNYGREMVFSNLDTRLAAETLTEVDDDIKAKLVQNETPKHMAKIIENMDTDDAADFLGELTDSKAEEIISNISDNEIQEEIQELLEHDEHTAGGLMSTEVFEISGEWTKDKILNYITEKNDDLETVYDLYVIDDQQKLLGTCSLRDLLVSENGIKIKEIMNSQDIKSTSPKTHWKEVASIMSKYNLINLPIIDDTNELLGIVSVDDLLPWLLNEK